MRCIREILCEYGQHHNLAIVTDEFEVRLRKKVPDHSYDIYISSGGPGSPLDSEGSEWEAAYFGWLREAERLTQTNPFYLPFLSAGMPPLPPSPGLPAVSRPPSGSFPSTWKTKGRKSPYLQASRIPSSRWTAVAIRSYSPTGSDWPKWADRVLAIEKERPHVPLERAIMAIRFSENMIGTQFHPEADATGMSMYLQRDDRKKTVIDEYGEEKWRSMIDQLNDPDKIRWTYSHVIPNFLDYAMSYVKC